MGAPQNVEVPLCLFYISITSLSPYHNHLKPQCHKEVRPLVLHQISGFFLMYFLVTIGKSIYRVLGRFQILMRPLLHSSLSTTHSLLLYPTFLQSSRRSGPGNNPLLSGGAFLIWLWCCRRHLGILDFLLALLPHI